MVSQTTQSSTSLSLSATTSKTAPLSPTSLSPQFHFSSTMGAGRRHDSPTGVPSSPKSPKVGFAEGLVTSISRPVNNEEHWTLYYFETHAVKCKSCFEPLTVAKTGRQLCSVGHELAVDVARLVFRRKDGAVYSREKEDHKEVRVELPHDYKQCLSLLKAIQRSLKNGERFIKPKSHDRTYFVAERRPRTPERFARTPEPAPRYETRTAEPSLEPAKMRPTSRRDDADDFAGLKRGSLYGSDMDDLERAQLREARAGLRFNVEVREPSYLRSHRRFSTYT